MLIDEFQSVHSLHNACFLHLEVKHFEKEKKKKERIGEFRSFNGMIGAVSEKA